MPPKKIGRPLSETPKHKTLRIRVDDETIKKIEDCSTKLAINRSEVVRRGIDMVSDSLKK